MARGSFKEIEDLATLKKIMSDRGVVRLYVKKLSPNDNSKNQPGLPNHWVYLAPSAQDEASRVS